MNVHSLSAHKSHFRWQWSIAALTCVVALADQGYCQVVQLPSVRNFSMTGGVSVPDGGTASLGGTGYSATSRSMRGPFPLGTRVMGGVAAGASLSVSAQIIDLDAIDEALLGRQLGASAAAATASTNLGSASSASTTPAAGTGGPLDPQNAARDRLKTAGGLLSSTKDLRPRRVTPDHWARILSSEDPAGYRGDPTVAPPELADANTHHFLRLGREAEQAGRSHSASVYYRMAIDAMSPQLKQRYQAALDRQAQEELEGQAAKGLRK
jgi:hypothetical protein